MWSRYHFCWDDHLSLLYECSHFGIANDRESGGWFLPGVFRVGEEKWVDKFGKCSPRFGLGKFYPYFVLQTLFIWFT